VNDFNTSWENGSFVPIGYSEEDHANGMPKLLPLLTLSDENPLWCRYSRKLFASEGAYNSYLKGKNFQKAKRWYETTYKVCKGILNLLLTF
jgi:hypothetical protein